MREATEEDLPEIVRMGELFAEQIGIPFDEDSAVSTAKQLIDSDDGVLLIQEGAMAGALAYPLFLNHSIKIAQELFWWVDPERRGGILGKKLLSGLENWAISVGAHKMTMISMDSSPGYVDDFYKRSGYIPFEKTFVKVL